MLLLVATACTGPSTSRRDIAVFVNGDPIPHAEVEAEADRWINANKARDASKGIIFEESGREATRALLRHEVLESLIERRLIAQQLRADNLEITEDEVDKHLQARMRALGQTPGQAAQEIEEQGKTLGDVRERIRWHTLGVEKLYTVHAADKQTLSDEAALKLYNDYPAEFDREEERRVRHILIRVNPDASAKVKQAARAKMEQLLQRIRAGEDFAALAKEYSDDELSRNRGGDRGFSGRGFIRGPGDDPFGDVAFAMKQIGEISDVVETRDGFHVIELTGLKEARRLSFEEVKDGMIADFRHREIGRFWSRFGGDLRAAANLDWTSHELFRQARAKRLQEKHNAKIERMIAREQRKAGEAPPEDGAAATELRTDVR